MKPSVSRGYLISCPVWSKFCPRPECQKGNTPGFPVILGLEQAKCGDIAPASAYLPRKGSAAWPCRWKRDLQEGSCLNDCLKSFSGFRQGKAKQSPTKQKRCGALTFALNVANPGLRDVGIPSTALWVKRMLSYFENQVRSCYNFNQRPEPQLSDQALDGSGIARTAWNAVPFSAVCVLKTQTTGK